jgi:hypothetical protein
VTSVGWRWGVPVPDSERVDEALRSALQASSSPFEQYLGQVAAYAYALVEATGRPVARVTVLSFDPWGSHEQSLEGPAPDETIGRVLAGPRA